MALDACVAERRAAGRGSGDRLGHRALDEPAGRAAKVLVGHHQHLIFRETSGPIPEYDGHHIAIYIADFSGPHKKLQAKGLVSEESDQ